MSIILNGSKSGTRTIFGEDGRVIFITGNNKLVRNEFAYNFTISTKRSLVWHKVIILEHPVRIKFNKL